MTARDAVAWVLVGVLLGLAWWLLFPAHCMAWAVWLKRVLL